MRSTMVRKSSGFLCSSSLSMRSPYAASKCSIACSTKGVLIGRVTCSLIIYGSSLLVPLIKKALDTRAFHFGGYLHKFHAVFIDCWQLREVDTGLQAERRIETFPAILNDVLRPMIAAFCSNDTGPHAFK